MAVETEELRKTETTEPMGAEKNGMPAIALLNFPLWNRDIAFTNEERSKCDIEGLVPHTCESLERQVEPVLQHLGAKASDLEQYVYLTSLADRNETETETDVRLNCVSTGGVPPSLPTPSE